MKPIYTAAALMAITAPAYAGNLTPPWVDPPVMAPAVPAFTWSGPYFGLSTGITRTKERRKTWGQRDIVEQETRPFNKVDFWEQAKASNCNGGADLTTEYTFHYPGFDYSTQCQYLIQHTPDAGWATATVDGYDPVVTGETVVGTERYQIGAETVSQTHRTVGAFIGYRHQWSSGIVGGVELAWDDYNGADVKAQAGYGIGRALPYLTVGYNADNEEAIAGLGFDWAITDNVIGGLELIHGFDSGTDRIAARVAWKF